MNVQNLAQNAYAQNSSSTRTMRDTEYRVIARVSYNLKAAIEEKPVNHAKQADALIQNRRLWDLLAIDVADKGNQLPEALRAQILYLAEFVNIHTSKVMAGKDSAAVLLEINASILKGLSAKGRKP